MVRKLIKCTFSYDNITAATFHFLKDFYPKTKRKMNPNKPKMKRRLKILKSNKLSITLKSQEKNRTWDSNDETDSTSEIENNDDSGESFLV